MARITVLCVLLVVALVQQPTLASRRVINAGGEFRLRCSISRSGDAGRYATQFFIEKTEVKMFNSRSYSDTLRLVSNGTTIVPTIANYTDRYMVEEYETGRYMLTITNVTESDSAWYGCRNFDVEQNRTSASMGSTELLVPGPFDGIFWTANYSKLSLDVARQHEVPDGGTVLTDNAWHGPNIACAVLVSNVEPAVNITIGRFGEPGSVDITDQFETRSASTVTTDNVGTVYRETVFFVKKFKFTKTSLRDVYCRASLFSTTYEKSVNIQVTSKPKNRGCEPWEVAALMGNKNVNLTCLIEAHPEPYVEWILPSGMKINALSNDPNYTVTNEATFEGLITTLTISEITEGIYDFGRIVINATNTEGSGEHYLYFNKGDLVGAAGITRSSAVLITMTTWLMLWILK